MRPLWEFGDLLADLRALGVRPGQDLLVHSSLRRLGPVAGGASTLLDALREVTGPAATIVVPAYTAGNSGSSTTFRAATRELDAAGVARYLVSMPGFDPQTTPSEGTGAFSEYVRTSATAVRSGHPHTSFAAIGARAMACTAVHDLDCHLGERSPLGWLCREQAAVLLLGVGYAACSAFHLAEYRLPGEPPRRAYYCVTITEGKRREHEFWDVDLDESDFAALGDRMDCEPFICHGRVGTAECRLVPIQQAVDFAMSDPGFGRRRSVPAHRLPAAADSRPGVRRSSGQHRAPAAGTSGRYFFLSYARLQPLPSVPGVDVTDSPDEWVRAFFRDLSGAVGRRAAWASGLRSGFLDAEVPAGSHWRSGIADALGAAEVFVPLLSPDYYRRSWPVREATAFRQRVRDTDPAVPADSAVSVDSAEPRYRFAPVLWEPLPAGEQPPGVAEALSLAHAGGLRPYSTLGLRTLLRLPAYHECYLQILGELATRIVWLAEKTPIGPSLVRIPEGAAPVIEGTGGRVFTVTMGAWPGRAGAPPAEYVRLAAERLGFAVRIREFSGLGADLTGHPGLFLVTPDDVGAGRPLRDPDETIAGLPPWVLPIVVAIPETGHPPESGIILEKTRKAYISRPEKVRRGLAGVSSLRELVGLAPFLIAHAEREYLRHSAGERDAPRFVYRPRLAGGGPLADRPGKENPHV